MSDYRDTIKAAIENGFYLDSCGSDERYKVWGRYIDLCGMDVKDAIPLGPEDCGGGGGGDKSGKTKNTVTLLMASNAQGDYTLRFNAQYASTEDYQVSFVMNGVVHLVTVPAGASMFDTNLTGEDPKKPYATISDVNIMSESETYTYVAKNTVKTGLFILTINKESEQIKESVEYGTTYTLPFVEPRTGYDFIWKDDEGTIITGDTITMPEKDYTITGKYEAQKYTLSYEIVEINYEDELVSSSTSGSMILEYGSNLLNALNGLTPNKEGHTLSGWKYESDDTNVLSDATMPNYDVDVYNVYLLNIYTLTYKADGLIFSAETYYFGQEIVPISDTPSKEGYTFNGWDIEIPETMPASDLVANAKFTINTHTITFIVDGETYFEDTLDYGAAIVVPREPTKEGYTFSGWSEIPETMPDEDVVVNGSFTINSYELTYIVDGEPYSAETIEYGAAIVPIDEPEQEGYTFSGWSEIPETMPAHDVVVEGTFTINSYIVEYIVDGEPYSSQTFNYSETIIPLDDPTREGYTFSGWSEIPETMPAHDITVTGEFTINSYELTYVVDGEPYSSMTYEYGEEIIPLDEPEREGYTFSGWTGVPETMPAHDVVVNGEFIINTYELSYIVDGELYSSVTYEYGEIIVPLDEPEREGYTFSGWTEIPETMPAYDVTVEGEFIVNEYTLTFIVDGEPYSSVTGDYGTPVPEIDEPEREGHTFSGWDYEVPETFPASSMTFNGELLINSYVANYVIDGEPYSAITYEYGETIEYPDIPKSGYTLEWDKEYETMPAFDITISGTYVIIPEAKTIYYNAIYTSGDTSVSTVSGLNEYDYEESVEKQLIFTIPGNPEYTIIEEEYNNGEITDEEFDDWCNNHAYSMYFATPNGTKFTFKDSMGNDISDLVVNVGEPFDVDGNIYNGHVYRPGTPCVSTDISTPYKLTIEKI